MRVYLDSMPDVSKGTGQYTKTIESLVVGDSQCVGGNNGSGWLKPLNEAKEPFGNGRLFGVKSEKTNHCFQCSVLIRFQCKFIDKLRTKVIGHIEEVQVSKNK